MNDRTSLITKPDSDDTWMETYTGKYVNPLRIEVEDIDIKDIAHHLSLICRFSGACKWLYTVGQHSLHVCYVIQVTKNIEDRKTRLAALLHDASEAYTNDVIRPWKYSIPKMKEYEAIIEGKIVQKFGLSGADWAAVKEADNIMCMTEARDLMFSKGKDWLFKDIRPMDFKIVYHDPSEVEATFLTEFEMLGGKV